MTHISFSLYFVLPNVKYVKATISIWFDLQKLQSTSFEMAFSIYNSLWPKTEITVCHTRTTTCHAFSLQSQLHTWEFNKYRMTIFPTANPTQINGQYWNKLIEIEMKLAQCRRQNDEAAIEAFHWRPIVGSLSHIFLFISK